MLHDILLYRSGQANVSNGTVYNEHWEDVRQLAAILSLFNGNYSAQNNTLNRLSELQDNTTQTREMMQQCRRTQHQLCEDELTCENNTNENCSCIMCDVINWTDRITDLYCDDNTTQILENSTTQSFYNVSTYLFDNYQDAWTKSQELQVWCDALELNCTNTSQLRENTSLVCEGLEDEFQQASCTEYRELRLSWSDYITDYNSNKAQYNSLADDVRKREADRKIEWDVLTRVICLLTVLTDPEEVGDGYLNGTWSNASIDNCWNMDVNVSHLDILYGVFPPMLELPNVTHVPCTTEFHDNETLGAPDICQFVGHGQSHSANVVHSDVFRGYEYHCACPTEDLPDWVNVSQNSLNYHLSFGSVPSVTVDADQETWAMGDLCQGSTSSLRSATSTEYGDLSAAYDDDTVSRMAYAHASSADFCSDYINGLTSDKWFCCRGGILLLDATTEPVGQVAPIASMEILPASDDFSSEIGAAFAITFNALSDVDCNVCTDMKHMEVWQFVPMRPEDATNYCWTWGADDNQPALVFQLQDDSCKIAVVSSGLYV